jgi:hypothetical protein
MDAKRKMADQKEEERPSKDSHCSRCQDQRNTIFLEVTDDDEKVQTIKERLCQN